MILFSLSDFFSSHTIYATLNGDGYAMMMRRMDWIAHIADTMN